MFHYNGLDTSDVFRGISKCSLMMMRDVLLGVYSVFPRITVNKTCLLAEVALDCWELWHGRWKISGSLISF
jgi:hypothetical protein